MVDEDYDLFPHGELKKLEDEIRDLKRSPASPDNQMKSSMDELSSALKSMITIFGEAKNELRIEDEEKELLSKKIQPMMQKLDTLLDQNEKIAEGILSVADMIKKLEDKISKIDSKPSLPELPLMQQSQPQPAFRQQFAQQPFSKPAMNQMPQQGFPGQMPGQMPQGFPGQMPQPNPFQQPQAPSFGAEPKEAERDLFSEPFAAPSQESPQAAAESPAAGSGEIFKGGNMMPPPPPPKPAPKKGFFK
jgi:hypothetical protein